MRAVVSMERKVRKLEKKLERRKCVEHPRGRHNLREQHEATHLPFRDWCAHCVRGAGEKTPHRRKGLQADDEGDAKIPRVVLNYHFMSTRDAANGKIPVLAMKDESTGDRYLRAVGHKGVEGMDWLVKDLHEELKSWGGTWVDQEATS